MTQAQLEQAGQIDVRYFRMAYEACPMCGRRFDAMHPAENILPHFYRECVPTAKIAVGSASTAKES
jgi:hypothetical protein